MKNLITTSIFSLLIVSVLCAQEVETRSLATFDEVHIATGIQAKLQAGTENSIRISAEGIDIDRVTSQIKGGELIVKIKSNWKKWNFKRNKVKAIITYAGTLDGLAASSGASLMAEDALLTDVMQLDCSSGANLEAQVIAKKVRADVSSGSTIEVSGSTDYLIVDSGSGARFEGYNLEAQEANVDGSSGSTIRINVSQHLDADVSSGASVKYKGSPDSKDVDKSSGGSVRAAPGI